MDIKLENIMVKENCELVLSDFGQTMKIDERQCKPRGTEFYMSPEIFSNYKCNSQKTYDPQLADSFSLGVMVYALTFGLFPWKNASFYDSQYRMFMTDRQQFWKLKLQNIDCRVKKQYIEFTGLLSRLLDIESERLTVSQFVEKLEESNQMLSRKLLDQVYNDDGKIEDLIEGIM